MLRAQKWGVAQGTCTIVKKHEARAVGPGFLSIRGTNLSNNSFLSPHSKSLFFVLLFPLQIAPGMSLLLAETQSLVTGLPIPAAGLYPPDLAPASSFASSRSSFLLRARGSLPSC